MAFFIMNFSTNYKINLFKKSIIINTEAYNSAIEPYYRTTEASSLSTFKLTHRQQNHLD